MLQFKPVFPTPVHRTADMFINITYLISLRIGNGHNDPGLHLQYRMTHYIIYIRLAKWRFSELRQKLQSVHEGFVLFVFWFVVNRHRLPHFLHRFRPVQSESPEQTALIFASNICQRCWLTNWAIADVGQDTFDVERMSTTTETKLRIRIKVNQIHNLVILTCIETQCTYIYLFKKIPFYCNNFISDL